MVHAAVERHPADWVQVAHVAEHCAVHVVSVRVQVLRQLLLEHRDAHCVSCCPHVMAHVPAVARQLDDGVHASAASASPA